MKEEWIVNASAEPDESGTDVVSLLRQMQQQLVLLEEKVDLLVNQAQRRPTGGKFSSDKSFKKRPFPKQFHPAEHSPRHGKREYGHSPRERDSIQGHFYEHRPQKKGRGPASGKHPFSFKRKEHE